MWIAYLKPFSLCFSPHTILIYDKIMSTRWFWIFLKKWDYRWNKMIFYCTGCSRRQEFRKRPGGYIIMILDFWNKLHFFLLSLTPFHWAKKKKNRQVIFKLIHFYKCYNWIVWTSKTISWQSKLLLLYICWPL